MVIALWKNLFSFYERSEPKSCIEKDFIFLLQNVWAYAHNNLSKVTWDTYSCYFRKSN